MAKTTEVLVTNLAGGTRLDTAPAADRQGAFITNFGANAIYVSFGAAPAGSKKGTLVAAGTQIGPIPLRPDVGIWAIADTLAQTTGAATILSEF